jgi:hypothetical protein
MDANTAQTLLKGMFDANWDKAISTWKTALDQASFGLFWDFWAVMIPVITYMYTQSERATLTTTVIVLTIGYQAGLLKLSVPVLVLTAVILTAKLLWSVVAQVRT